MDANLDHAAVLDGNTFTASGLAEEKSNWPMARQRSDCWT